MAHLGFRVKGFGVLGFRVLTLLSIDPEAQGLGKPRPLDPQGYRV